MGITLEKIELVKDRTGVTYKEAKDALEKADGNVVDAIVSIEENIDDMTSTKRMGAKGSAMFDKVKEIVQRGNITRIVVSYHDTTVLNIPLNAGVLGVVIAPWGMLLAALAAFGFKCTVDLIKEDGSIISISDKAGEIAVGAREAGNKVAERVKEKAPEVMENVTENVSEMVDKVKGGSEKNDVTPIDDDFNEDWFKEEEPEDGADEGQIKADASEGEHNDAAGGEPGNSYDGE